MKGSPLNKTSSTLLKWLLALLLGTGLVFIARASIQSTFYLPLISYQEMTETPTPSQTPTVTGTITITPTATVTGTLPTPTQTHTPTPTATLVPGVFIVDIEFAPETHPLDEYVTIRNQTGKFIPMEGWTLRDENQNTFTFPRYTLISWATVKVWTKAGTIDPENLYWGRIEPVWNDYGDCAYLRDDENKLIDSECYGALRLIQIFP
ncbi:MAG: lamin tail domain-containing protein [Chloroflexi bacterium]|nr:lamin tail domain-containing protein [Chloroflexota bacterium]